MPSRGPWGLVAVALLLVSSAPPIPPEELRAPSAEQVRPLDAASIATQLLAWNPKLGVVRSERIASAVLRCEREQRLVPQVVLAVMKTESTVRPSARSPKGAVGLMQVMPHMFAELGLPGPLGHLETNIEAGCMLLADNIRRLGAERGISAYFWGSQIRNDGYLRRVKSVLEDLAYELEAEDARSRG